MLTIAQDHLPMDLRQRHAILRDYFCDIDADASLQPDGWKLSLAWPAGGGERHVDPALAEGLAWWGAGVSEATMSTALRREGRVLSALYDTWTLHSWSRWAARRGADGRRVLVLHVDDHRDLGSPRIFSDHDGWYDAITGRKVDFFEPEDIEASILSGAAGMGSFLTPVLHALRDVEVRHLCQAPKATATQDFTVILQTEPDTLIDIGRPRLATRLQLRCGGVEQSPTYRVTPHLTDWLDGIEGPDRIAVLLHVDMDYFNNRYDGDSEWKHRVPILDPPLDEVVERVNAVCDALDRAGLVERIEDAVVAYSPGFFPAELWRRVTQQLQARLGRLYAG